jgi:hypothetical protein
MNGTHCKVICSFAGGKTGSHPSIPAFPIQLFDTFSGEGLAGLKAQLSDCWSKVNLDLPNPQEEPAKLKGEMAESITACAAGSRCDCSVGRPGAEAVEQPTRTDASGVITTTHRAETRKAVSSVGEEREDEGRRGVGEEYGGNGSGD